MCHSKWFARVFKTFIGVQKEIFFYAYCDCDFLNIVKF